jgi:hypothetical protein
MKKARNMEFSLESSPVRLPWKLQTEELEPNQNRKLYDLGNVGQRKCMFSRRGRNGSQLQKTSLLGCRRELVNPLSRKRKSKKWSEHSLHHMPYKWGFSIYFWRMVFFRPPGFDVENPEIFDSEYIIFIGFWFIFYFVSLWEVCPQLSCWFLDLALFFIFVFIFIYFKDTFPYP